MKKYLFTISLFIIFCLLMQPTGFAQGKDYSSMSREQVLKLSTDELVNMPLEDIMKLAEIAGVSIDELFNILTKVSSKKALSVREAPSILTIITSAEIQKSGARTLVDVIRLVPGYNFGHDMDAVISLISRGNWGHEGKILLLIDGQEMNELMYSGLQFNNHYNIENINRIEIIRGPGSSIYGGFAELGVINIITNSGEDIDGISVGSAYGRMKDITARTNVNLSIGKKINDFDFSVSGHYNSGNSTNQILEDFWGDTYDAADGWFEYEAKGVNAGVGYKNFAGRFIFDEYSPTAPAYPELHSNNFRSLLAELKYDFKLNDKFTITPKLNYKNQEPWELSDEETEWFYHSKVKRLTGSVGVNYDITNKLNLIAGAEYYSDKAEILVDDDEYVFYNDKKEIDFNNTSFYLQGYFDASFVNITLGGRYDSHSQGGSAFSPRICFTEAFNHFHYKLLISKAFRAPSIENYNLEPDISSEETYVYELELGYKANDNIFFSINMFDITIKDPIIYLYDANLDEEFYQNFEQTGSVGFEFTSRIKYSSFFAALSYSYYNTSDKNKVETYKVDDNGNILKDKLLAAPQHKIALNGSIDFTSRLSLSPSVVFLSSRYAYTSAQYIEDEDYIIPELSEIDPSVLINLYLSYDNLFIDGLNLGIGVYDLLNQKVDFFQPYNGEVAPYPGAAREILLKLTYDLKL